MAKNTDLFDLIHSLNQSEKRYFKLEASKQQGEKNYLKLFDAIDKQSNYDEDKLLRKFKTQAFSKQFSSAKNYLYNLILKSLSNYHSDKSVADKLQSEYVRISLLHIKGLHEQCYKLLKKVKKEAYRIENFGLLVNIIELEMKIIAEKSPKRYNQMLLQLTDDRMDCMNKYANSIAYHNLIWKAIYWISKKGIARNENENRQTKIQELMANDLLQSESKALSVTAKLHFNNIWFLYEYYQGNYAQSLQYKEREIEVLENHPLLEEQYPEYVKKLSNAITIINHLRLHTKLFTYLDKLKQLLSSKLTAELKPIVFISYYNAALISYAQMGVVDKPLNLIPEINEGLKKYQKRLHTSRLLDLFLNICILYFKTEQFEKAQIWLEKVLSQSDLIREDVHCFARVFDLLIHFELDNDLLLESLIRNYKRYLKKREKYYLFEDIILQFLKKSLEVVNLKELQLLYQNLHNELLKLQQNAYEKHLLQYFDFIAWVEAKIQRKPLIEILRLRQIQIKDSSEDSSNAL